MRRAVYTIALAAMVLPVAAHAQSDVVVMRRVIAPPAKAQTGTPTPTNAYYSWQTTPWAQTGECGAQGVETRNVSCARTDGVTADDAECVGNGSGPKPIASQTITVTQTCGYAWQPGAWNATPSTCGSSVISRDIACVRSDGVVTTPSLCSATAEPAVSETITDYSGCSFLWFAGSWSDPSTLCGKATETRGVVCQRSDGTTVSDGSCVAAGTKPSSSQTVTETSGCTAYWSSGAWGAPAPACGSTTENRTVTCRSGAGATLDDSQCTGAKPATSRTVNDTSACSYTWTPGAWSTPATTCGSATETRTYSCIDRSGAPVDPALCTQAEPTLTSRTATIISGCSYSWTTGDYGAPQPACGSSIQTRNVICVRSDGTTVADGSCDAGSKPAFSQTATDYTACTYAWTAGPYSDPSTTCGQSTQTRVVSCQRADGQTVGDSQCSGTKPDANQSVYETSGCEYTWSPSTWSVTPGCGSTTETRYVSCLRSDGQPATNSQCAADGAEPSTTGTTTDTSACSYSWAVGTYSDPSTTCGQATQTRTVICQRSDGTTADDALCASTGTKPDASQTSMQTSSCSYSWSPEAWNPATPACGASTHSRTVDCLRSDGAIVGASFCSGTEPPTSEATTDYTTCTYAWTASTWLGTAGCGDTVTQSRNVACQRSNGDDVTTQNVQMGYSYCSKSSMPAATQPITDYSQCSFSWQVTNGPWSNTCSTTATRSNTVVCKRSDGTQAASETSCTDPKPATTDTGNVTGCTYAGAYSPYSACTGTTNSSSGTQTSTIQSCTRSDTTTVDNSLCTPQTRTQSCSYTYVAAYSAYGTCNSVDGTSNGAQTRTITSCTRDDNTSAATSYCSDPAASASCTATAPAQLINNGNFATDASFWTLSSGVTRACVGSTTLTCFASTTTSGSTISQTTTFATVSGASYAFAMAFGNQSNTGNHVDFSWSIIDSAGKTLGSGTQGGSSSILGSASKLGTITGNGNTVTIKISRTYGSGNTVAYGKFSLLKQ